jgi:hypothetical protein
MVRHCFWGRCGGHTVSDMMAKPMFFTALAVLCFGLPFFEVSCQGYTLRTVRGVDLVIGHDLPASLQTGMPQDIASNVWAVSALIFAIVALIVIVVWRQARSAAWPWVTALTGATAVCLLLLLASARNSSAHHPLLVIHTAYGYYLALILMIAAIVTSVTDNRPAPGNPSRP